MKMIKYIASLAVAVLAMGFTSCDDEMAKPPMVWPENASTGTGEAASPYSVDAALMHIYAGTYTSDNVFVEGIITQIDENQFDPSYGNITYYIADKESGNELEVYRGLGLNGAKFSAVTDLKVGDRVVVLGQLTLYNSTAEFTQGAMIVSINGSEYDKSSAPDPVGDGSAATPYNVSRALQVIKAGESPESKVYIKGVVSSIEEIGGSYGNATYNIADAGYPYNTLKIYRGYGLNGNKFNSADDLKVGDEVVVYGQMIYYNNNTPEVTQGSMIVSINGSEYDTTPAPAPEGDGTQENPYNTTAATEAALAGLGTTDDVYVKGIVSSISDLSTSFGNATYYISHNGKPSHQFYIYRGYYLNGDRFTSTSQLKVGDEVVVAGKFTIWNGSPQMAQGNRIVSINTPTE